MKSKFLVYRELNVIFWFLTAKRERSYQARWNKTFTEDIWKALSLWENTCSRNHYPSLQQEIFKHVNSRAAKPNVQKWHSEANFAFLFNAATGTYVCTKQYCFILHAMTHFVLISSVLRLTVEKVLRLLQFSPYFHVFLCVKRSKKFNPHRKGRYGCSSCSKRTFNKILGRVIPAFH